MDVFDRMLELSQQGFYCAQIMLKLALELQDEENPDLVRAMAGLNGGVGNCYDGPCGAYTGGACLLAFFAGKGEEDEIEHEELTAMQRELRDWFADYASEYGGTTCTRILAGNPKNKLQRCPVLVRDCFYKCIELLNAREIV